MNVMHLPSPFVPQMDPTQLSFSVASLLGEKLAVKSVRKNEHQDAGSRHVLPPTPQPSDSEEDEPPRKRRCVEHCELAKVNKTDSLYQPGQPALLSNLSLLPLLSLSSYISLRFLFASLIDWNRERADSNLSHSIHLPSKRAHTLSFAFYSVFLSFE